MKKYSRLRAVIDLDAVMYNMEMMHANIEKGTKMVVVIKTDGYGHGAVPISRMLEDVDYVWGYAVATLDEGVVLRKAGIQKPILCLGCIFPDQMEEMIRHEIRMTTYSYELAKLADETAYRMGKKAYLHIKIDTGMSRLGFPVAKESVEEILKIGRLVYTDCEGMFTHFSKADETDKTTTLEQIRAFLWMKEHLAAEGIQNTVHLCCLNIGCHHLKADTFSKVDHSRNHQSYKACNYSCCKKEQHGRTGDLACCFCTSDACNSHDDRTEHHREDHHIQRIHINASQHTCCCENNFKSSCQEKSCQNSKYQSCKYRTGDMFPVSLIKILHLYSPYLFLHKSLKSVHF